MSQKLLKTIKASSYLLFFVLAILSLQTAFEDYQNEATNTRISYAEKESMQLPTMTICAEKPYKEPIYDTNLTLEENTISWEEIFAPEQVDEFQNETLWDVQEFYTFYHGKCFVLNYLPSLKEEISHKVLKLTARQVYVFLGSPGEEIWIKLGFYDDSITRFRLDFATDIASIDISLNKKELWIQKNCHEYQAGMSYSRCFKNIMKDFIVRNMKCMIPELKEYDIELEPCKTLEDAREFKGNLSSFVNDYTDQLRKNSSKRCQMDCHKFAYEADLRYFSQYAIYPPQKYCNIFIYYPSMVVEERREYLIYDGGKLLSAIGGSIGLFLGFSCASIFTDFMEILWNIMQRRKSKI